MKPLIRNCHKLALLVMALSVVVRIGVALIDNVDRLEPVIRRSPDTMNSDDQFGFSVVMHQLVANPSDRSTALDQTRIIVGAPRGSFPGGLTNVADPFRGALNETGLVYMCPLASSECGGITGDTTVYINNEAVANNDISQVSASPSATRLPDNFVEGRLFDQAPDAVLVNQFFGGVTEVYENKTGQLLGASLYSDGDNFIACAPRWTTTNGNPFNENMPENEYEQQPRGICYASGRSLTGFTSLRACVAGNSGRSTNTEGEGYCIQGTSVTVANGYFVVGVPGLNENRGAVFTANISDPSRPVVFAAGTEDAVDPNNPNGPLIEINDQYQAFRVARAYVTVRRDSGSNADVIATVPRYHGDTYEGRINVFSNNDYNTIVTSMNAQGSQMGEFFGHSIAVADLNGDGYDEVIIGAPMYTDFDSSVNMIEVGRVYVFFNNDGNSLSDPIILQGPQAFGRFGYSLVNLGDVDDDGYEDFVVGAPYTIHEDDDDSSDKVATGSIYIYYGNSNLTEFENQVPISVTALDIVNTVEPLNELETFGFSLASGVDVDNNEFDDLAIGAYKSQMVVLLRTLPVADVNISLTTSVSQVDSDQSSNVFVVTVSGSYTGRGLNGERDVRFTLSEVVASGEENRLFFTQNDMNSLSSTATLIFPDSGDVASEDVTVYVKSDITISDLVVGIELLPIERTISNTVTGTQVISDFDPFPLIRQLGDATVSVDVVDPCNNDGCQSDLVLNPIMPDVIDITAGDNTAQRVTISYFNTIGFEDAFSVQLRVTIPNTNAFSGVRIAIEESDVRACTTEDRENGVVVCPLRNRIRPSSTNLLSDLIFDINEGGLVGNEEDFTANLEIFFDTVETQVNRNTDNRTDNNMQSITFRVAAIASITAFSSLPGVVEYMGTEVPSIQTANDLGQPVELIVNIGNTGPTTIPNADFDIWVPSRNAVVTGQNFFLYITAIKPEPQRGVPVGNITCEMTAADPQNLGTSQTSGRKRSISESSSSWRRQKKEAFRSLSRNKRQTNSTNTAGSSSPVIFSCADEAMRSECTQISCRLQGLPASSIVATVTIVTRVDGRFFGAIANGRTFNLTAFTRINVLDDFFDSPSVTVSNAMSTISLRPMMDAVDPGDDTNNLIHVIIWPTLGGLIIIVALAVFLYFLGFFRRKKPEEQEAEGDFEVEKKPPVEGVAYKPEGEVVTGV